MRVHHTFALALALAVPLQAQPDPTPRRVDDAAPHRTATALATDASGFLWIGTPTGLARYDGHRSVVYTSGDGPRSLPTPYVNVGALAVDADDAVWAGTKGGLCRVSPDRSRVRCLSPTPAGSHDVRGLAVAPSGAIWAGTESGVAEISADGRRVVRTIRTPPVRSVHVRRDGTVLVGTTKGLLMRPSEGRMRRVAGALHDAYVTSFVETPGGLWAGTFGDGVYRSPGDPRTLTPFVRVPATDLDLPVISLSYDPFDGEVWAGTWERGVYVSDETAPRFVRPPPQRTPPETSVAASIGLGRSGRWVGTWGGLYHVPARPPYTWLARENGLLDVSVDAVATEGDSALWVAQGTNLFRCRVATSVCRPRALDVQASITDLATDENSVWVTTFGDGVWRVPFGAGSPERRSPPLFAYAVDVQADSLWVATLDRGVLAGRASSSRPDALTERLSPDRTGPVLGLLGDPSGLVALATQNRGTCRADQGWGACATSAPPTATPTISIALARTEGALWIGTSDGLRRASPRSDVPYLMPTPRRDVSCLVAQPDAVWAATGSGIYRVPLDSSAEPIRGAAVGLPALSYDTTACTRVGRRVAVGHRDGLLLFDPTDLAPFTGRVVLADIVVDGQRRAAESTLTIGPREGGPSFLFAAPRKPGGAYRYRLRGLSDAWTVSSNGEAIYPTLPPGRYVFEAESDGEPGADRLQTSLRVMAPLWRRPWALVLQGLALALLVWGAYTTRIRALLRVERARQQIADDLHDDVGSRLSGLALALDVSSRTLPLAARRATLTHARDARDLLADLRDTVWVVDGRQDSLGGVVDRVRLAAETLFPDGGVHIEALGALDATVDMQTRRHLLFFCKEALHNASRHACADSVQVRVESLPNRRLIVRITDDGVGFDASEPGGRGLDTLRRRADALGASVAITSVADQGTQVDLALTLR